MKITYQNKLVAFIDILGFKNIIYASDTKPITKYFDFVFSTFNRVSKKRGFNYHLISDSIVVSTSLSKENLILLTRTLCVLQSRLLAEGILVRGSISYGQLYLNKSKNIIVGNGLINAYNLEQQAIYPRIIIDKTLIKMYYEGTVAAITELKWVLFESPLSFKSDFIYLNYCRSFSLSNQNPHFKTVLQLFKDNYYKNVNIDKYEWLKTHISISIKEQLEYLNIQIDKTPKERYKMRVLQRFLSEFDKL